MGFLEFFSGFGMSAPLAIVSFLFVLTIIVFVHELGHFLVARWCDVAVKVFSIGFGPELYGFDDRHGTRWKIAAIPLGGYVKFLGDETEAGGTDRAAIERMSEAERGRTFAAKGVGARAAIVAAGPLANFLLAIVIFAAIFSLYGRQITEARVDAVIAGSAAEAAGFQTGDLIVSIDGTAIDSFSELQRIVALNADNPLRFVVERNDAQIQLTATPRLAEEEDRFGNVQRVGRLGISRNTTAENVETERLPLPQAIVVAVEETWFVVKQSIVAIAKIVSGRESTDQLGGPIRIAQMSGQIATLGIVPLMNFIALISISIGLINLFPIPILDGGHLLFFAVEAIRGRPLSERAQEICFRIGFVAVIMLMIFATWNDIMLEIRRISSI
jgi:regulator of sigma E protease